MSYYHNLALVAQECGTSEDMASFVEQLIKASPKDLSQQDKTLFSMAYKNMIGSKRNTLLNINGYEIYCQEKEKHDILPSVRAYKKIVEDELAKKCQNVIDLIDNYLLKKAGDDESFLFYHKMKGDFNRYIAENVQGPLRKKVSEEAIECYKKASNYGAKLEPINPIVLGNSLNFAIFYCEIMKDNNMAKQIANDAYTKANEALGKVDQNDAKYNEAIELVNTLKENIDSWN